MEENQCSCRILQDKLYESYSVYCKEENLFPVTRDYMSKVIVKVFPGVKVQYLNAKKNGKSIKIVSYTGMHGLGSTCSCQDHHDTSSDTSHKISLPEFCTLHHVDPGNLVPNSIHFSVPTLHVVNNTTVKFDVQISEETLTITVLDKVIDLPSLGFNQYCSVNQRNLKAVVTFVRCLNLCKGIVYCGDASLLYKIEDWSDVDSRSHKQIIKRLRHRSCKAVVPISATGDHCSSCRRANKYLKEKSLDKQSQNGSHICSAKSYAVEGSQHAQGLIPVSSDPSSSLKSKYSTVKPVLGLVLIKPTFSSRYRRLILQTRMRSKK